MSVKDFQVIAKLGEGAYSSVYKVKRVADGMEYALKKVKLANLSDKEKQNALNEVRILASVRCLSIVAYKEVFLDQSSNSLCIVMEYVNHGDLFQRIVDCQKKGTLIPEPEIWNIFLQVTKGLKSLHDLKIFHRDLKSANVFLNKDGTVKLGDMNVSKIAKKGLLYTQTGTPYYASPEVWKDQPYDQKSDIWSLGCVLYEMTTLKPPFRAEDMEGLYKKVIRGYYPKIPQCYSQDLSNVIRALLQVPPHLRPSCDKILQLPSCTKRMDDKILMEADEGQLNLLQTIRIPKNMHYLTERLPKPNYSPLKLKKIDKHKFIQTLAVPSSMEQQEEESEFKENHSAEYSLNRLPKIHKRSNPPERNGHSVHNSQAVKTPPRNDRNHESQVVLPRNEINDISNAERRQKNISKNQGAAKIEELLLNEKRKQYISSVPNAQSIDAQQQYEKSLAINQIYGGGVKKVPKKKAQYEVVESKQGSIKPAKQKNLASLLDVEGETKPLSIKVKKNQNSVANLREDSMIDYDSTSKLPQIGNANPNPKRAANLPVLINQKSTSKVKDEAEYPERKVKQRVIEGRRVNDQKPNGLPDILKPQKHKAYDDDDDE